MSQSPEQIIEQPINPMMVPINSPLNVMHGVNMQHQLIQQQQNMQMNQNLQMGVAVPVPSNQNIPDNSKYYLYNY